MSMLMDEYANEVNEKHTLLNLLDLRIICTVRLSPRNVKTVFILCTVVANYSFKIQR